MYPMVTKQAAITSGNVSTSTPAPDTGIATREGAKSMFVILLAAACAVLKAD